MAVHSHSSRLSASTASTPASRDRDKRCRDSAEFDSLLEEPPLKRMEMTPCHTPQQSPSGEDAQMGIPGSACVTPLQGASSHGVEIGREIGVKFAVHLRKGPRS